jgi:hypothetical protein
MKLIGLWIAFIIFAALIVVDSNNANALVVYSRIAAAAATGIVITIALIKRFYAN